jgi:hypothetical protein
MAKKDSSAAVMEPPPETSPTPNPTASNDPGTTNPAASNPGPAAVFSPNPQYPGYNPPGYGAGYGGGYPGYSTGTSSPFAGPPAGFGGPTPTGPSGDSVTPFAVAAVVTSISENRSDGAWWVIGTVGGAAYNFRWARPLDPVVPGGMGLAQAMVNEYQAVQNILTATFLGKTINVVMLGTPTPQTFAVAFSATLATAWQNPGAGQMVLQATVNASAASYPVNVTINEFLEWANAGLNIGQIIATRIVQNYNAATSGFLLPYIGTFSNITPQMMMDTGKQDQVSVNLITGSPASPSGLKPPLSFIPGLQPQQSGPGASQSGLQSALQSTQPTQQPAWPGYGYQQPQTYPPQGGPNA